MRPHVCLLSVGWCTSAFLTNCTRAERAGAERGAPPAASTKGFLQRLRAIDPFILDTLGAALDGDKALERPLAKMKTQGVMSLHSPKSAQVDEGTALWRTTTAAEEQVSTLLKRLSPASVGHLRQLVREAQAETILLQLPDATTESHLERLLARLQKVDPKTADMIQELLPAVVSGEPAREAVWPSTTGLIGRAPSQAKPDEVSGRSLLQIGIGVQTGGRPRSALEEEERLLKIRPLLAKLAHIDRHKFGKLAQVAKLAQSAADSEMRALP